ncbi:MAG TPA: S8 family serine peptidase [Actinomycetota bacterium]|nr:S8 family serine peptidase [Actinomycetota bacterium]
MKAWSKSTLVAFVSAVLAVALIQPVVAGPVEIPPGYGWVKTATDPAAVLGAIAANPHKLPAEFQERLKYVRNDGTLQVMVALNRRNADIERFMTAHTNWLKWYGDGPRFLGRVTADQFSALLGSPATLAVEPDFKISSFMSTSTLDVHARSLGNSGTGVWSFDETAGTMGALRSDVPGLSVDEATGKGVAVAITDSGIDRTHRDFGGWDCAAGPYAPCESRIVKAVSIDQIVDTGADPSDGLPTTEAASGHGTHVAGTIGGNGYYTRDGDADPARYGADGHNFGIAPQVNLVSVKNGDTVWAGLSSFGLQWTLDHAEEYGIRVSSNSWGCLTGCSFSPNGVVAQVSKDLYDAGVLVVFAAGNGGGTGSGAEFAGDSQSPYVLAVANYNDADHRLNSSSSRGASSTTLADPTTWTPESEGANGVRRPDIAAPGTDIWSARSLTGGVAAGTPRVNVNDVQGGPSGGFVPYAPMSGTSMAAPHVAGAAALLFSACPDAAPLDVMRAFMSTAADEVLKTTGNAKAEPYEVGYGALEIRAALDWLLARNCDSGNAGGSGEPTPTPTVTPTDDPTSCPTSSAAAAAGSTTRYYFHSETGVGNEDWAAGSSTFDTTPPTDESFSEFFDLPGIGNGAPTAPYDPWWQGTVDGQITGLKVDFWHSAPVGQIAGRMDYTVFLWAGATSHELGTAGADSAPENAGVPERITHEFTTLADGSPLAIDPAGQPVTISIQGLSPFDVGAEVIYDSTEYPSGFEVTTGGGPSPEPTCSASPTPTVTPTPTDTPTDPGPAGQRGTYPLDPNDPFFAADPDLPQIFGGQWGMRKIQAPQAWQESQATGFGVKVGVLDSGLDLDHPDFDCSGKVEVIPGADVVGDGSGPEDVDGHGTHVAGIVGACTNNEEGVVGVAPDATIMPIQVLNAAGEGAVNNEIPKGIHLATDAGASVINMSIGTLPVNSVPDAVFGRWFEEVDEAVEYASARGVVIVAAAGNETQSLCGYPAIVEDIVCVGSTDNRDLNAWYGNFPVKDDDDDLIGPGLMAPGGSGQIDCGFTAENIYSTYAVDLDTCDSNPGYIGIDGTSMASPHVAGVAALVYDRLGERSEANGRAVVEALINTTDDLYAPGYDPMSGYGRVNALKAVQSVEAVEPPVAVGTSTTFTDASATAGQFSDAATIAARLTAAGAPVNSEELTFDLTGLAGSKSWTAITNENGVASKDISLDLAPGSYSLSVRYAGSVNELEPSADLGSFVVEKEDTATVLTIAGTSSSRSFSAKVTETDGGTGLAGVTVEFFQNGNSVGSAVTNANGVAILASAPKYSKKAVYEAVFAANDFYLRSAHSVQEK